jgi:hypothetical protein
MSEWQASKILESLASLNFLFIVIHKLEVETKEDEVRVSRRVLTLVSSIKKSINVSSERISLSKYTRA